MVVELPMDGMWGWTLCIIRLVSYTFGVPLYKPFRNIGVHLTRVINKTHHVTEQTEVKYGLPMSNIRLLFL